jgi:large subunit ribosomal protein L3
MPLGLLGKKVGMTQIFDETGTLVPVTLIQAGPCVVVNKRSKDVDGYEAVQVGYDSIPERLVNKPDAGQFKKAGVAPLRVLREFRGPESQELEIGQALTVSMFEPGERIDVVGTSKGRGFTSVRKRWNSKPGRASHGSMYFNRPGSQGASSFPSRTFPGTKSSGHHGDTRETTTNLLIVKCDPERNLIAVRGSVPGATNGYVLLRKRVVRGKKALKK